MRARVPPYAANSSTAIDARDTIRKKQMPEFVVCSGPRRFGPRGAEMGRCPRPLCRKGLCLRSIRRRNHTQPRIRIHLYRAPQSQRASIFPRDARHSRRYDSQLEVLAFCFLRNVRRQFIVSHSNISGVPQVIGSCPFQELNLHDQFRLQPERILSFCLQSALRPIDSCVSPADLRMGISLE
jgi:hypothetical protein